MKNYLFIFIFFFIKASGQTTINISLNKQRGEFISGRTSGDFIKDLSAFKIDTSKYKMYGVWKFEFDFLQNEFNKAGLEGLANKVKVKNTDSLFSLISPQFENSTYVLTAFRKDGRFVLVPDLNRTKDFTNQTETIYRSTLVPLDSASILSKSLPIFSMPIATWLNGEKHIKNIDLQFIPKSYFGGMNVTLGDSIANKLIIMATSVDYYKGEFTLANDKYLLYMKNPFPNVKLLSVNDTEILVAKQDQMLSFSQIDGDRVPFYLSDTILVSDELYRVINIDPLARFLSLAYVGKSSNEGVTTGLFARNFKANDVLTGTKVELASLKGKYILLDFWGTWCIPCKELEPELKKIKEKYEDDKLKIIGIAFDKSLEVVKRYLNANQIKWTNLFQDMTDNSKESKIIKDFKVTSYPTNILIDPEGKILYRSEGVGDFKTLKKVIDLNLK